MSNGNPEKANKLRPIPNSRGDRRKADSDSRTGAEDKWESNGLRKASRVFRRSRGLQGEAGHLSAKGRAGLVKAGEAISRDNNGTFSNSEYARRGQKLVKHVKGVSGWTLLSLISFAVIILMLVYMTNQNRTAIQETQRQGQINQQYIRCILLIPRDLAQERETLTKNLDECAINSALPPGEEKIKE